MSYELIMDGYGGGFVGFSMRLPHMAVRIIETLEAAGFETYAVGGCVRDAAMGRAYADVDIATAAGPRAAMAALGGLRAGLIPTGLQHGTFTVAARGERFEVTAFRVDGGYSDGRRPDSVAFTEDFTEDLRRRDFTINAMGYSPGRGLVDVFGGMEDLRRGVVRCVGEARERFGEDYLRMARAYRFAAVLGFELDGAARAAAIELRGNITKVSAERIRAELDKLLLSDNFPVIEMFLEDFAEAVLPEVAATRGVVQNNIYHVYDVYNHTLAVLRHTPRDASLRLAALLHDTGKPGTAKRGAGGVYSFKGHEAAGERIARSVLKRLKYDNATIDEVTAIVASHDDAYKADAADVKRMLPGRFGAALARKVLDFVEADTMGKSDAAIAEKLPRIRAARAELERVLAAGEPYAVGHLAVNGRDVMAACPGIEGRRIGEKLGELLERVIDEPGLNERETLLGLLAQGR